MHRALAQRSCRSAVHGGLPLYVQKRARITSRQRHGNVNRWNPTALLVTIGNYWPDFGDAPSDGTERCITAQAMTDRFAVEGDPEAFVLEGDFKLKARIIK